MLPETEFSKLLTDQAAAYRVEIQKVEEKVDALEERVKRMLAYNREEAAEIVKIADLNGALIIATQRLLELTVKLMTRERDKDYAAIVFARATLRKAGVEQED